MSVDYSNDDHLVGLLVAGDADAFAWLLDQYSAPLLRLAMQYVPSRAIAEEVVQDTWLAVIKGIDRFERRSSLKTWLFRVLANLAKTRGQREQRTIPFASVSDAAVDERAVDPRRFRGSGTPHAGAWAFPPTPWPTPEQHTLDREALAVVRTAIDALPLPQREVISMRDILEWTAADVCAALELTEVNQRVLLHRARSKVRAALERHYDEGAR